MSQYMQETIAWLRKEIEKLERSPSRENIRHNIADLRKELARLEERYPVNPSTSPADAATTI